MDLSLKGRTALVCGSTQGIGLAAASEISLLGADCILIARNEERLKTALESLDKSLGQQHGYLVADFSRPEQVEAAVLGLLSGLTIQILVNNTGGPSAGPIVQAEQEAFQAAFSQHLICNHLLARAVLPGMQKSGYGRIINILSTSVKVPIRNLGVSNTTRWAVAAWSKTLAGELAPYGITVNNVLPGSTMTGRLKTMLSNTARQFGSTYEAVETEWLQKIPMGRFGKVQEIAALVAFLASPAASFITGASIPADGGQTPSI
ncbi:MAG TPA: SDR family oxidoreductase [Chitinophagaceae bacterium]|nr:SDR family oxidoreductase [Chitinophagaceae bacterium]